MAQNFSSGLSKKMWYMGWHSEIGHVPYRNGWQLSDIKCGQFDSYDFVTKAESTKWHTLFGKSAP